MHLIVPSGCAPEPGLGTSPAGLSAQPNPLVASNSPFFRREESRYTPPLGERAYGSRRATGGRAYSDAGQAIAILQDWLLAPDARPTEAELQAIAKRVYGERLAQFNDELRLCPHEAPAISAANRGHADFYQQAPDRVSLGSSEGSGGSRAAGRSARRRRARLGASRGRATDLRNDGQHADPARRADRLPEQGEHAPGSRGRGSAPVDEHPGIGPITATAIAAISPPAETFANKRNFAAWLGLVPQADVDRRQAKARRDLADGRANIAASAIIGASAVVLQVSKRGAPVASWLEGMLARKPRMLVTTALAAKIARTFWALLTRHENYGAPDPAAA